MTLAVSFHYRIGILWYDLETEINMLDTLVDAACRYDVDIIADVRSDIVLSQASADLNERRSGTPTVLILDRSCRLPQVLGRKVVEHDDVCAGLNGLYRLCFVQALDLDFDCESTGRLCGSNSSFDGAVCPDVVVLQHCHGRKILAMWIATTDDHAVFLDNAEARRGLASAGQCALPAGISHELLEGSGSANQSAAAREGNG